MDLGAKSHGRVVLEGPKRDNWQEWDPGAPLFKPQAPPGWSFKQPPGRKKAKERTRTRGYRQKAHWPVRPERSELLWLRALPVQGSGPSE